MNNVRLWIVILAATCFLAGFSAGLATSRPPAAPDRSDEPFHDYRTAFVRQFALDAERERLFAELLRNYQRDLDASRERVLAASRSELEPELAELGLQYRRLIRDHVLPPARRAEFDALTSGWAPIH